VATCKNRTLNHHLRGEASDFGLDDRRYQHTDFCIGQMLFAVSQWIPHLDPVSMSNDSSSDVAETLLPLSLEWLSPHQAFDASQWIVHNFSADLRRSRHVCHGDMLSDLFVV